MKLAARIVVLLVILAIAVFAVANRAPVAVSFWPLPWDMHLPLYVAVLGAGALGLIAGGAGCWASRSRLALRARAAERRAQDLAGQAAARERADEAARRAPPAAGATVPARTRAAMDD